MPRTTNSARCALQRACSQSSEGGTKCRLTTIPRFPPSAFRDRGTQQIYVFVNGGNHLYVKHWDGFNWHWADQGGVPGGFLGSLKQLNTPTPTAITYLDGTKRIIEAFVVADDGMGSNAELYVNRYDGSAWDWENLGAPPNAALKQIPSAITYSEGGKERSYIFAGASDNDLYVNYGQGAERGAAWKWANQGHPPVANPSVDIGARRHRCEKYHHLLAKWRAAHLRFCSAAGSPLRQLLDWI
jgi:hypothetical protein